MVTHVKDLFVDADAAMNTAVRQEAHEADLSDVFRVQEGVNPAALRRAAAQYEQAVALDPGFFPGLGTALRQRLRNLLPQRAPPSRRTLAE